ncbi:hypothetical protein ABZ726_10825 [Streptomyces hundungensis]|uniref:hypothetical protein n=1 Tax=Streptomyces hundungensis TaxID=1077946 RepID=UPI0034041F4F
MTSSLIQLVRRFFIFPASGIPDAGTGVSPAAAPNLAVGDGHMVAGHVVTAVWEQVRATATIIS